MIRTLATVAEARYDRWYVVAHSLGTVIALNGLMETPYAWPGYFVEAQWRAFCEAGFGGPGDVLNRGEHTMPVRPVWALPDELAYRRRIFEKFRGLLTLGSPLEKYAAIWPARVPLSRMPAFQDGAVWVNVFDPIDPVSSPLKAFGGHPEAILPVPVNIGYTSSWAFLLAHLCYLKWSGASGLADGVANWLLTGDALYLLKGRGRFGRGSRTFWCRTLVATAWYGAVFVCLCFLAGWTLRGCDAGFTPGLPERWSWFGNVWQWLWQPESLAYAGLAIAFGTAVTLILGTVSYALLFKGKADAPSPPTGGPPLPDPGLPPRS
jgi:hypothetical protein